MSTAKNNKLPKSCFWTWSDGTVEEMPIKKISKKEMKLLTIFRTPIMYKNKNKNKK